MATTDPHGQRMFRVPRVDATLPCTEPEEEPAPHCILSVRLVLWEVP